MHRFVLFITLILVIAVFATSSVAQTITLNNNLVFGNMFPSIPKTITKYTVGSAAEFHVAGTIGSEISVQFTLPTYMSNSGFTIQLIFFDTDLAFDTRPNPNQGSPLFDNLNPWTTLTEILGAGGLTIYLGGTAVPKIIQFPGAYTATIVLTVAYTGA